MFDQYLYWLNQVNPDVQSSIGDKALYLGLASQHKYPVLPGVVVSAEIFTEFLTQIQWLEPFLADLPNSSLYLNVDHPQQLQAITRQIQHTVLAAQFPPTWAAALEAVCQSLPAPYLICRPSIAVEGHPNPSLSLNIRGLLSSQICRKDAGAIAHAIQQIWAELFSARSMFVWQRTGIQLQRIQLGVLVQPIYSALVSGTLRPCANGIEVEASWGLGLSINQGLVIPDRYLVNPHSGEVIISKPGRKSYAYSLTDSPAVDRWSPMDVDIALPDASQGSRHLHMCSVAVDCHDQLALSESMLNQFAKLSQSLSADLDIPVSLEWAIGSSPLSAEPSALRYGWLEQDKKWLYVTQVLPQPTVAPAILTEDIESARLAEGGSADQADHPQADYQSMADASGSPRRTSSEYLADYDLSGAERTLDVLGDRPFLQPGYPSQPVSTPQPHQQHSEISMANPIAAALGASSGQVVAPAWVVPDTTLQSVAQLPTGYVLVASDITPDWLLDIKRAVALVSERGGMTCHAAILARELGIPAVVGVDDVTQLLSTGDMLLINGDRGTIHRVEPGQHPSPTQPSFPADDQKATPPKAAQRVLQRLTKGDRPNATQLMVSLSQPEGLEELDNLPIDGIGLLRSELLLPVVLNRHPLNQWIADGNEQALGDRLFDHLRTFVEAMYPAPVYYRSHDLRAHEFAALVGDGAPARTNAPARSPSSGSESNPLLGLHGTLSYLRNPALFTLELATLHRLRQAGYDNVHLILPFVRTVEEYTACQQHIRQANLLQFPDFQVWIMAEVPSVLFLLPEYVAAGISGIAIGTNDLTQFILAIDRTQPALNDAYNPRHPAVLRAIRQLITTARQLNLPCSICGEAPSQYPDFVKQVVEWGATSISVSPSATRTTYRAIAQAEKELILKGIRPI